MVSAGAKPRFASVIAYQKAMDGFLISKIKIYHLLRTNLESRRLFSLKVNLLSANGIVSTKPCKHLRTHWSARPEAREAKPSETLAGIGRATRGPNEKASPYKITHVLFEHFFSINTGFYLAVARA